MIITYIIIQKGIAYPNLVYDFIDRLEKRIPAAERILFDIGSGGENGNKLYSELKSKYNFQTSYLVNTIDKKGNSSWKLTKQPLIIQFESKLGGTNVGGVSPITSELIQAGALDSNFLDRLYPVKSTETPTQNPTSTPTGSGANASSTNWSALALIGGAAVFLFALLKKKSRR